MTSFFRNPEVFEALKSEVFSAILKGRADTPIRIWAPGCSTGEGTYSLAIVLNLCETKPSAIQSRYLGTDLNEKGIEKARAGVYTNSDLAPVSPERLRRYQ